MDAWCAPQRVLAAHPANQLARFGRHARTTGRAMTGFPRPEEAEACPVPTDDRLGFHDNQRGTPVPPSYCQPCPQEPVHRGQLRSFHRPLNNGELVAQSQYLQLKVCTAAKTIPQRSPNAQQCRKCGKKTKEDQPSMYQSDSNLREPQPTNSRFDLSPTAQLNRCLGRFLLRSFRSIMIHNQPRSTLSCEVSPDPLHKNAQAKTGLSQKLKVDSGPCEPCYEPAEVNLAALQDGEVLAHNGHAAFVEITEGFRHRRASHTPMNQISCVSPLLHCHLCDTW